MNKKGQPAEVVCKFLGSCEIVTEWSIGAEKHQSEQMNEIKWSDSKTGKQVTGVDFESSSNIMWVQPETQKIHGTH